MKIKILMLGISLSLALQPLQAQFFNGVSTSNYMGVSTTFINPANLCTSASRFSIDLGGVQSLANLNQGIIDTRELMRSGDLIVDTNATGLLDLGTKVEVRPLGFSFKSKKVAFAFTTRVRSDINFSTNDPKFVDVLARGFDEVDYANLTVDRTFLNMSLVGDIGLSASMPIMSTSKFKIFGGGTLRFYTGGTNTGINIDKLDYNYNDIDDTVTVNSADLSAYFGTPDLEQLNGVTNTSELMDVLWSSNAPTSMGGDLGVTCVIGDANNPGGYKVKIGASVTDIGKIKYPDARGLEVHGGAKFVPSEVEFNSFAYDSILAVMRDLGFNPQTPSAVKSGVGLPTTLHLTGDWSIKQNVFVHGYLGLPLRSRGAGYSVANPTFLTVTPRFQMRMVDVSMPVTYDMTYNNFQVGLGARIYFLYFGTQNIAGLFQDYARSSSVYAGISFGLGIGQQNYMSALN